MNIENRIELLTFLIDQDLSNVNLKRERAKLYYQQGKVQEAKKDITEILTLMPEDDESYYLLALINRATKKLNEAVSSIMNAIEFKIKPSYYDTLGVIQTDQQLYNKALVSFNKAIALDPNDKLIITNKAICLQTQGNFKEAIELIEESLERLGPDEELELYLGLLNYKSKKYNIAKKQFQVFIKNKDYKTENVKIATALLSNIEIALKGIN